MGVFFDSRRFMEHVDVIRRSRKLSWRAVAREAEIHPATLSRVVNGQMPKADELVALIAWSGLDIGTYIGVSLEAEQ